MGKTMVTKFKTNRSGSARVLTSEQIKEVFDELDQPHRLIAQICYYCASRVGEATKLSAEDIDMQGRAIVFRAGNTKTGDSRTAYICDELLQALTDAGLPKSGFIFPSPRSCGRKSADGSKRRSISRQSVDQAFRDVFDLLGIIGASTHSFRRSMATHLSREGLTLADIAQITGHKDLASLSHYLDPDTDKAISALSKIAKRSA